MATKTLESAFLKGSDGESVKVKVGEQVVFVNRKSLKGKTRSWLYCVKKSTEQLLGTGPYKIQKIERYDNQNNDFYVEGKRKIEILQ